MSDNIFDPQEPPLVPLTNPEELTPGETFWYEGEPSFVQELEKLYKEGVISKPNLKLPTPYLSVSQVELYLQCPLKYYNKYVLGKRTPLSVALVQGTTIHKAVEEGYRHVIINKSLPSLEFTLDTYSDHLSKNLTDDVIWENDDESDDLLARRDSGHVKDQGVGLIKTWHVNKLPKVKPQSVEKSFITTLAGIPVVGKIDLVDRIKTPENPEHDQFNDPVLDTVVDNKIVGKTYGKSMVDNKLQMTLYAHATGLSKQRYDLFVKTKIPKITEILTSRNAREIRWAIKIFSDVAKAISAGIFPACAPDSHLCNERYCQYWSGCRGAI